MATTKMVDRIGWFTVDQRGLWKLLGRDSLARIISELISNAWDEVGVTKVDVRLITKTDGVEVHVEDDAPDGFRNLTHAYTLFAESMKAGHLNQRGRFNLGEKLAIAAMDSASISTTTGTIRFSPDGKRRMMLNQKRPRGSLFIGMLRHPTLKLTQDVREQLSLLRSPEGITTSLSFETPDAAHLSTVDIAPGKAFKKFTALLHTERADAMGILKPTRAPIEVCLYDRSSRPTEKASWLLEMGIPVVEIDSPWDIDVMGKVMLTLDRQNITPLFRRQLLTQMLENAGHDLTSEEIVAPWVTEHLEYASPSTINHVLDQRFGTKRVSFDLSDPEANKRAIAEGYRVVHGNSLPAGVWAIAKSNGFIMPAGQVYPTKHAVFSSSPDAKDVTVDPEKWTPDQAVVVEIFHEVAQALLGRPISISIISTTQGMGACYGAGHLSLNVMRLGKAWFEPHDGHQLGARHLSLLLHELAHDFCADHLSADFHRAICDLGAKLAILVRNRAGLILKEHPVTA